MADHDEVYGAERQARLLEMLRDLSRRLAELDRAGQLLERVPELLRLLGEARSELFHFEVRSTYDTPEVAENRRLVEEMRQSEPFSLEEPEDDAPWRQSKED
ncbi:MAG: hypothetical protein ABI679_07760 [Gemmatimonadota bacterium]